MLFLLMFDVTIVTVTACYCMVKKSKAKAAKTDIKEEAKKKVDDFCEWWETKRKEEKKEEGKQ